VLELSDGETCRAPYLLPYTSPHQRAGIPPTEEVSFSMAVWQLNKRFFSGLPTRLHVSDMGKAFQAACASQYFRHSTSMEEVCDWHLDQLGKLSDAL
jgi:hypothetical protein